MLALLPRASAATPFLEDSDTNSATAPPPALPALAARASLPNPRMIFIGGDGGSGDPADEPVVAAEAGTAHTIHPGLAVAPGAAHAAHASLAGASLAVCLVGRITNLAEIASLYGLELSSDELSDEEVGGEADFTRGGGPAAADLLLDVAMRGFPDASGDASDQPATFFNSLRGSWAAVILGRGESGGEDGNNTLHVTVARGGAGRGAGGEGEEGEEEDEGGESGDPRDPRPALLPPPALHWGAVEGGGVVISTAPVLAPAAPGSPPTVLAPFPAGCVWEAGRPSGLSGVGGLSLFTRPSPSTRPVQPLARRDSRGRLCAVAYRSKSGLDLAMVE